MRGSSQPLITLPDRSGVLHQQLSRRIRLLIVEGILGQGIKLPSSRLLAKDLDLARNTVLRAMEQLVDEGWVRAVRGSGLYVASGPLLESYEVPARPGGSGAAPILDRKPVPFEMAQAGVDLFPAREWSRCHAKVWNEQMPGGLYEADEAGDPGLRAAIASTVCSLRGLRCDPHDVIVVPSTQSALTLLAGLIADPGDAIVVEDPGYLRARASFEARGLRPIPIPADHDGLLVDQIEREPASTRLAYVTPSVQFPTCVALSPARRARLMQWAHERDGWIIEDDFDALFGFEKIVPQPPIRAQPDHDRVIYISSFNRLMFPSLRLAFMVLPRTLVHRCRERLHDEGSALSLPNQLAMREFIATGAFAKHLRLARLTYQDRRRDMLKQLDAFRGLVFAPRVNALGVHLVLRLLGEDDRAAADHLRCNGIAVTALSEMATLPQTDPALLIGFAACPTDMLKPALLQLRTLFFDLIPGAAEKGRPSG